MKPILPVLALVLLAAEAGAAHAARRSVAATNRYDGAWSIEVITEAGSCDRAYRYGLRVENGEARYPGNEFTISGRVAANGAVRGTISNGVASASVVGRLGRDGTGTGTWRAEGSVQCRGRWNAERRG